MGRWLYLTFGMLALIGCNQGLKHYPTAKVTGQVMCNGQPVPNVRVIFAPTEMKTKSDSGKPAEGFAGIDGGFTLSTYDTNDGAVVGKHEVRVDTSPADGSSGFKCDCGINAKVKITEVEVKSSGENHFVINLLTKQQVAQLLPARTKSKKSKDEMQDEINSQAPPQ